MADQEAGIFADATKVKKVEHDGKYFQCHATPSVMPSPQGRPVLFQAGSSGRGQRFAIKHADVVFAIQPDLERMKTFMKQVRTAARDNGRGEDVRVTFAVQPFVAESKVAAEAKRDELLARIPLEAALTRISGTFGVDLDTVDLDLPLQEIKTQSSQGLIKAMSSMFGDNNITLREALRMSGLAGLIPTVLGSPEEVADELEHIWRETGCHGFNLTPAVVPGGYEDFVEHVVPILQKRGIFRTEYEADTLRGNLIG